MLPHPLLQRPAVCRVSCVLSFKMATATQNLQVGGLAILRVSVYVVYCHYYSKSRVMSGATDITCPLCPVFSLFGYHMPVWWVSLPLPCHSFRVVEGVEHL